MEIVKSLSKVICILVGSEAYIENVKPVAGFELYQVLAEDFLPYSRTSRRAWNRN
jgi:hypothetical protein